jgi:hypothetical protein
VRARMEDPQQPVVRASRSEEARQGHLPAVWNERGEGASRVDAREASRVGPRRAAPLARRSAAMGGGSHRSGRGWRRRMRARELSPSVSPLPRARHARMARATPAGAKPHGGERRRDRPGRHVRRGRTTRAAP